MKVKVISLPYILQVLFVLCFTRSRYQVSVYRTNGPLVYSGRIRTLVAMATYSFHRLIMGKEEIDNFFFCLIGDIWIFFTEMFIESSSTFHMTFVQIGEFDWLLEQQKGSIFVIFFKSLLLRNHLWDEAETWHTCLGH